MKFSIAVFVKYLAELLFFALSTRWGKSYLGILKFYRVFMRLNVLVTFMTTGIFTLLTIAIMIFVINLLAPELFFLILAHPVYKM